jgi:hypothetical protein
MGSAASSEKADEQLLEEMEVRVVTGAGVYGYEVTGAGNPVVNGVYVRGGLANLDVGLKPYYEHFEQPGLWLVRYAGGWCIVHEDKLDELWDGGDYYRQLDGDDTRLPPLFGWDAGPNGCDPVPCLRAIDEGPAAFVVEGAGYAPCNGQYAREGTHDGSPLYRMGQYVLVRARTNRYNWFIGDKDKLEENAGDLYSSACCLDYPSATGWRVDEDGREPAPRIYAVDAAGQKLEYGWHVPAAAPLAVLQAQVIAPGGAAF